MSEFFRIHPENPQIHLMRRAALLISEGGLAIYPTDTAYALGCLMSNKLGAQRIRQIRQLNEKHCLTLLCRDLADAAAYTKIENPVFRLLKQYTPGPYTFILPALKTVPPALSQIGRKTVGIRIPENKIARGLLELLDQPLITSTLIIPPADLPLLEPQAMKDLLGKRVDLIIDGGECGLDFTTVVDLVDIFPRVTRQGKGNSSPFA